ncbi:MAG: GNAT family N-acetyltransferase [Acidimicrobiales bacterium]
MAARPLDPARLAEKAADGRVLLVALDRSGEIVGYGDLESDGHIDHTDCRPDVVGTGVASLLYDHLEAHARAGGTARVYVEASEAARRLFTAKGFAVVRRQDLVVWGVALHNYVMEKHLTPDHGTGPTVTPTP